ncbi:hypothetical protein SAMN06269185_2142 [Natronoarchaeum philippinense]|uniref:Uncharacterized protein n=2 Tax=Natronoarchaeum philippinense TaxID=558529 RepID=A0A285P0G1_NATPI|nr:hypothetical protein SAMN06269185_2142 [Natronoarchaeum philippinense]
MRGSDDRGQAYTLEGIIGAMVLLTAVLMALNSAVLLPSTSGTIDRGVQSDVGQQATDVLKIADEQGSLSETLRCWDTTNASFYGANGADGTYGYSNPMDNSLGTMLNKTFSERFNSYSLRASYRTASGVDGRGLDIVEQGNALRKSITVTHTVTLYEDQNLTASCNGGDADTGEGLREAYYGGDGTHDREDGDYPIPPAAPESSNIYNVVEVRLTIIW